MASTACMPLFPLKTFAFPAFTTSPRAFPFGNISLHQITGWPGAIDLVITPATEVPDTRSINSRSDLPLYLVSVFAVAILTPFTNGICGNDFGASGDISRSINYYPQLSLIGVPSALKRTIFTLVRRVSISSFNSF